ncbi:MAG: hypothetical protein K2G67_06420 [Muribaculaceae bacterium]|nr:hypothetical protein [Muribaculaceae bacterium]
MTLEESITRLVNEYIDNFDRFDSNPQIRINPATLTATLVNGSDMLTAIADNDEAIEDAAAADGLSTEDAADFQASQNPDFYAVKKLLISSPAGNTSADIARIRRIAANYAR